MKKPIRKIARISTAAFLAGVTTLAVSLPMPAAAGSGSASAQRIAGQPVAVSVERPEVEKE